MYHRPTCKKASESIILISVDRTSSCHLAIRLFLPGCDTGGVYVPDVDADGAPGWQFNRHFLAQKWLQKWLQMLFEKFIGGITFQNQTMRQLISVPKSGPKMDLKSVPNTCPKSGPSLLNYHPVPRPRQGVRQLQGRPLLPILHISSGQCTLYSKTRII